MTAFEATLPDLSPWTSGTAPTKSAQKVGESILIKRENQLNTVSDSIQVIPLEASGYPRIRRRALQVGSIDVDDMISRLLDAGISKKPTKSVCLRNAEINALCSASQELLLSQPTLLELSSPLKIVGDLHGQYIDLIRLFGMCGFPPASNYLFLGNYVNQGKQSLETILLLLCYKLKYPDNFFLLRGDHECANSPRVFGFYGECKRRCNLEIWNTFINTFNCLPIASIVAEKIFCVHGGLSPSLSHIDDIRRIARPTDVPADGLLDDLLRSDPADINEAWVPNERGMSRTFGKKVTMNFLQRHDFDLICRGHMVVENGYEISQDRMLVTLFSAPCYSGDFDNLGAILSVSDDLLCNFEILEPLNSTILKRQRRLKRDGNKRDGKSNSSVYRHDRNDEKSMTENSSSDMLESTFEQVNNAGAPDNQKLVTGKPDTALSNVSRAISAKTSLPEMPDISQLGLASDLFKAILSLFTTIAQRTAKTKHSRRLRSELERFFLWGDAISISESQFKEVSSESSDLRQTVLSTLYELGKVINDNLLRAIGGTTRSEELDGSTESVLTDLAESDMAQRLQSLLKKAAPIRVAPETTADVESLSEGDSMRYDLDEVLDDVAIYIDCLMDLSIAIESPVVGNEPGGLQ